MNPNQSEKLKVKTAQKTAEKHGKRTSCNLMFYKYKHPRNLNTYMNAGIEATALLGVTTAGDNVEILGGETVEELPSILEKDCVHGTVAEDEIKVGDAVVETTGVEW